MRNSILHCTVVVFGQEHDAYRCSLFEVQSAGAGS